MPRIRMRVKNSRRLNPKRYSPNTDGDPAQATTGWYKHNVQDWAADAAAKLLEKSK